MKTSTLLAIGAVGALILIAKARKPGIGDADMLVPPPGRTVTASGQVLGDLGMLTTYQDAYDATPSQYNLTPRNDFVPGFGGSTSSLAKQVSGGVLKLRQTKVEGDTCYVVRKRPNTGSKSSGGLRIGALYWDYDATATEALRAKNDEARRLEAQALAQKSVNETLMAIQKQAEAEQERQAVAALAQQKAEQERQAAQAKAEQERPMLIHRRMEDMPKIPPGIPAVKTPVIQTIQPPKPPTNFDQAKQAYDAMAAAREQASMSQASSDTGYGRTSDDSGYGATQQVTEEGAPKLPERVASVQTPAAVMVQPVAPVPAAASGDSKVGLLVGGGVLAAIAAAMAV